MRKVLVVNGTDYTILIIGVMGGGILFAIQLMLCFKMKSLVLKCIPIYLVLMGGIFCLALWAGVLGSTSAGAISGNQLVAYVLGAVVGLSSLGLGGAWIVYWALTRDH